MLKRFTIRQRIIATFLVIVLTGGFVQLAIAGRQLQLATLEFYQHHLETDALLIASTLSEPLENYLDGEGTRDMQRLLASLQRDSEQHYLIVDRGYRVIAYTAGTGYEQVDRLAGTPELVTASSGQIGSDIHNGPDGIERVFVAVPVQYEGSTLGYLILSRPIAPAYAEVYQQWLELGSTTLPVIVLVIAVGLWLSGTISRPVQQLRNSAMKMARGDLSTRIDSHSEDEVGQLAKAFNYMAEQIEGLMHTQRSFVSNAAHELRTPLMTLKLRVEALEDDGLPLSDRTRYMREIQQEIDHMAELVSSLLVLARIDEGRHQPDRGDADTTSTLYDIARHWRIAAAKVGLRCDPRIPENLPNLPLPANDLRLVLDNLLGNAVKYTATGEIGFTVEQTPGQVIMHVCDTGIGFEPGQAAQLFTRFYRTEHARHDFEGNGLGLSIVQAILQQYGASITAESDGIGKGAAFVVRIPLIADAPSYALPVQQ